MLTEILYCIDINPIFHFQFSSSQVTNSQVSFLQAKFITDLQLTVLMIQCGACGEYRHALLSDPARVEEELPFKPKAEFLSSAQQNINKNANK